MAPRGTRAWRTRLRVRILLFGRRPASSAGACVPTRSLSRPAGRTATEAASGALEEEEEGEEEAAADADEEKENNFMKADEAEDLVGRYQIQNALPWTLPYISYPDAFDTVIAWMSFIELDFVRIVPICVEIKLLRRVRHRRDACSMAWRCGSSPPDGARTAASPRND